MSYDLLAFAPAAVRDDEFAAWWDRKAEWPGGGRYDDSTIATPALQRFYGDLILAFPPLNGPDAPTTKQMDADADLMSRLADYSIDSDLVYGCFAWSQAEKAHTLFLALAAKHGLAVAEVSDAGRIVRPPAADDRD